MIHDVIDALVEERTRKAFREVFRTTADTILRRTVSSLGEFTSETDCTSSRKKRFFPENYAPAALVYAAVVSKQGSPCGQGIESCSSRIRSSPTKARISSTRCEVFTSVKLWPAAHAVP